MAVRPHAQVGERAEAPVKAAKTTLPSKISDIGQWAAKSALAGRLITHDTSRLEVFAMGIKEEDLRRLKPAVGSLSIRRGATGRRSTVEAGLDACHAHGNAGGRRSLR